MPSQIQIEANRANAQLSTRPGTEDGKTRAALNSRKHGLSAAHLVTEPDRETFDSMPAALLDDLAPQGELELSLFDTLLHANWNIRRCRIREAGLLEDLEQNEAKLRQLDRYTRRHDSNLHRAAADSLPERPSPLVDTQAIRWALLRERAAAVRIDSAALGRALDQFRNTSTQLSPE